LTKTSYRVEILGSAIFSSGMLMKVRVLTFF